MLFLTLKGALNGERGVQEKSLGKKLCLCVIVMFVQIEDKYAVFIGFGVSMG